MARRFVAVSILALFALFVATAQADTGDIIEKQNEPPTAKDGWQAGTCTTDTPTKCSPATAGQFFKTAGGHPKIGFTQYIVQHSTVLENVIEPLKEPLDERDIKTLRVDLPPGLSVNPSATGEQCTLTEFLHQPSPGTFVPECKAATKTGEEQANLVTTEDNVEFPPSSGMHIANKGTRLPLIPGVFQVPVYNLVPKPGEPALFGFVIAAKEPVFLETEVSWESDFHESFTVKFPVESEELATIISRLVNFGEAGNGTFITNPNTCYDPSEPAFEHLYSTWFRAESWGDPNPTFPVGSTPVEAGLPPGVVQEGCDAVPFDPTIDVKPGTTDVDSPAAAVVTASVPFENPKGGGSNVAQAQVRNAKVTLPAGMGLNPSGANGLQVCTDAQFKKGVRVPANECPADSKIGTVEIETPPLPPGSLKGDVYVGEQKSSDPTSGEEFRFLAEAKSEALGTVVRVIGNVAANPTTGQLTATIDEQEVSPLAGNLPRGLPQVPLESAKFKFDGPHLVLTSPGVCAPSESTSTIEPWSSAKSTKHPTSTFELTTAPGGGACPKTLAARPFAPVYTDRSDSTKANAYSPFRVNIVRTDGQQELKVVNATLPKGLSGKLAGIPYCSDAALAAAAGKSGAAEIATPSCSGDSQIGTVSTRTGTGASPLRIAGKAYLAGPYKGAPLSLATVTPAVAGPFDLGTVVVRIALNVDPETTVINAVSDVIPDVYGGVKLDVRGLEVNVDRANFMHNPTNCAPQAVAGTLSGGGADPTNPAAFSSYAFSTPYQATECDKLGFKPKLFTKLLGGKKTNNRRAHPQLRAILETRESDANVLRTAVTLPHSILLDNAHIKTICTRVQLSAQQCPKASIYGQAQAKSPLLDGQLKGPVYLVSSNHQLPDLLADLHGQVNVRVRGVISSKHGGIKTVFNNLPDAPVKKFILKMKGGKQGLLINSQNLCKVKKLGSVMNMKGQNGKQVKNNKLPLKHAACPKKH